MKTIITKYPIWSFLIINYLISWSFLYPCYQLILNNDEIPPLAFIGLIGGYGPTIAAILVQWIIDKSELKRLLLKIIQFRISAKVLAIIILIPILLYILSQGVSTIIFGGEMALDPAKPLKGILVWILLALPFGPMGEELGWRGYMLPKLLARHSVIKSTILVGLAWGVWHLASFTFPGAAIPSFLPVNLWTIILFCCNTIGISMIYTY
ncbi:MAG: CPBP family intramembrane metalloprotease, partial [Saprospiraceae bacterium]|nr:CPBP family intramembrane metalloprotease [Saprospiraceae bacterium]